MSGSVAFTSFSNSALLFRMLLELRKMVLKFCFSVGIAEDLYDGMVWEAFYMTG